MTNSRPPQHTFDLAKQREEERGCPQYVVRSGDIYVVTERMPMVGEWYTTDQLRHG